MKSNKGFTLIELLAVIVILAIIALIATPTILGVIETARQGSAESSALGYVDAVEKQIMINEVDSTAGKKFDLSSAKKYTVAELKGKAPSDDSVVIVNDKGEVQEAYLYINDAYQVHYTVSDGKASATKVDSTAFASTAASLTVSAS